MFAQLRHQISELWQRQSRGQRILILALVAAGAATIGLFTVWASTPSYAVAFRGLSEADAGQIVDKLAADEIPYKVERDGTVLVPSDQVYEVRMSMARQGLPQGGTVGFELFSGTTLGMTEFTQRVNYQRALEGELERTIGSLGNVDAVRVHIVTPEKALLASEQEPTTASVTLQLKPGMDLNAAQVRAITHLVASSVEGLTPENVVVVDVAGNLLAGGASGPAGAAAESDGRRAAEAAYAAEVEAKVRGLLEGVLGPNKSVVKASVTMNWSQVDIVTQEYDPESGIIRSSQTLTETFAGDSAAVGGVPGAASNLPDLTASETVSGTQGSLYQRLENTTNYEITQVESHEVVAPGQVERISLSVMVDGVTDADQLASLQAAVVAAAGIDEARGDTVAVESLAFDRSYYTEQAADMEKSAQTDLYIRIGSIVGAVVLLAVLLWYVQRLLANLRLASAEAWTPALKAGMPASLNAPAAPRALTGGGALAAAINEAAKPVQAQAPEPMTEEEERLQRQVLRVAEQNPATVAEIIHLWMKEDEVKHG